MKPNITKIPFRRAILPKQKSNHFHCPYNITMMYVHSNQASFFDEDKSSLD